MVFELPLDTGILFSNTTYAQVGIAIHQSSAGLSNRPSQNTVFELNTLHIDGIDLNDLEQELDTRYLKLPQAVSRSLLETSTSIITSKLVVTKSSLITMATQNLRTSSRLLSMKEMVPS